MGEDGVVCVEREEEREKLEQEVETQCTQQNVTQVSRNDLRSEVAELPCVSVSMTTRPCTGTR